MPRLSGFSLIAALVVHLAAAHTPAQPAGDPSSEVRLLDVMKVSVDGNPQEWIKEIEPPKQTREFQCDLLVVGGGTGGVAAALTGAKNGRTVCLTEETDWLGGQFTSQGVAAMDDNRFIEEASGTASYYDLRRRIRDFYLKHYQVSELGKELKHFNPGNCYVSPLCFEPKVGVDVVRQVADLEIKGGRLKVFLRTKVFWLEKTERHIGAALAYRFDQDEVILFRPKYVLDATELGDLLPLAGVRYYSGSESRSQTGESHAPEKANADCVQAFTYTFALEYRPGERHVIARPPDYERFRKVQPYSFSRNFPKERGWAGKVTYRMFGEEPPTPHTGAAQSFFPWRRLIDRRLFDDPRVSTDIALINWFSNDYRFESFIDRTPEDQARILQEAKRLSLGFVHWLQTEAPRDDGRGKGYPELKLRSDLMGSADGLSKYPYIRESRRIQALRQVIHEDTGISFQKEARARWFDDSVGIGLYMIDIHGCGKGEKGVDEPARPFQVPLRALLTPDCENLIASAKNIGTTHITNGAYRMHPVEWNVGESAAHLADFAVAHEVRPHAVPKDIGLLRKYQRKLLAAGIPLVWFDDLKPHHRAFAAIQYLALLKSYPSSWDHLHAHPEAVLTRGETAWMLCSVFAPEGLNEPYSRTVSDVSLEHPYAAAVQAALEHRWMILDYRNWFHADEPLFWGDIHFDRVPARASPAPFDRFRPVSRGEFSQWLVTLLH